MPSAAPGTCRKRRSWCQGGGLPTGVRSCQGPAPQMRMGGMLDESTCKLVTHPASRPRSKENKRLGFGIAGAKAGPTTPTLGRSTCKYGFYLFVLCA